MNDQMQIAPTSQQVSLHYEGERLNQMYRLAKEFHAAGCFGGDVKNSQQALVKMQAGYEMGIPPVEAMNSLYIVNGKITIWGMAMSKRLRQKGWKIAYDDSKVDSCTVTVSKGDETHTYTATLAELKSLRSKAAEFAPKDKMKWHALSRLIRFYVPEVMDAGVAYLKEEAEDIQDFGEQRATATVIEKANFYLDEFLKKINQAKNTSELSEIVNEMHNVNISSTEELDLMKAIADKKKSFAIQVETTKTKKIVTEDTAGRTFEAGTETTALKSPEKEDDFIAGLEEDNKKIAAKIENPIPEKKDGTYSKANVLRMMKGLKKVQELQGLIDECRRAFNAEVLTQAEYFEVIGEIQEKINGLSGEAPNQQAII